LREIETFIQFKVLETNFKIRKRKKMEVKNLAILDILPKDTIFTLNQIITNL